jgi:hypothetical protein
LIAMNSPKRIASVILAAGTVSTLALVGYGSAHAFHAAALPRSSVLISSDPAAPAHAAPRLAVPIERILSVMFTAQADAARARLERALGTAEPFLALLPLDRLRNASLEKDRLRLVFDFGRERTQVVRIPSHQLQVLEPDDERDPLRGGRVRTVETASREVIVHDVVELELTASGIAGLRGGGIQVRYGFLRFSLDARTVVERGRIAFDGDGHIVLATDERGQPRRDHGRFVPRRYDVWLVLEAAGHKFEIGVVESASA